MYKAFLTIPKKIPDNYNLYVYRSKNWADVASVKACRKKDPIMKIDQTTAPFEIVDQIYDDNGDLVYWQEEYQVYDYEPYTVVPGIDYYGPHPTYVPDREFELTIEAEFLNKFTFRNYIKLKPLPLPDQIKDGVTYTYSIIAVDDASHLVSGIKTHSVKMPYPDSIDVTYHIWQCNNYTGEETDTWEEVGAISADTGEVIIGKENYNTRLGIPIIETVPDLVNDGAEKDYELRVNNESKSSILSSGYITLELKNPWQANNKRFNYRKLKSYKVVSSVESEFSDASEPTFQALVPVSIEKMIIWMNVDPNNPNLKTPYERIDESADNCFVVVRKEGVYYNRSQHKKYGYNLWYIPSERRHFSVFAESSIQDKIKIQIPASTGHTYTFDVYLVDVYGNHSKGIHYKYNA